MNAPALMTSCLMTLVLIAWPGAARGDAVSPPEEACDGSNDGEDCSFETVDCGECVRSTCTRYTGWGQDGGPSPQDYSCLVCEETDCPRGTCSVGALVPAFAGPLTIALSSLLVVLLVHRRRR